MDLSHSTAMEAAEFFVDMSNEEIRNAIPKLNLEQLQAVITHMNEKNTPYWQGKTRAIILGLTTQDQLEVAGKSLSVRQILDFFESDLVARDDNFNKLLAILVGMSHATFADLLLSISEYQLQVLLQTSLTEPLQYKLTVFNHEINNKYLMATEALDRLMKDIECLSIDEVGRQELIDIKNRINDISLEFHDVLEKIKNALRIAWNTHRSDLIESLNNLKEHYFHTLHNFIGHPETIRGATGLYELLNERLNSVFGNPFNMNEPESLGNNEPAIDALVKFSIWYLQDYWEVGLLPNIKSPDELELDPEKFNELERAHYRDKLFDEVKNNLKNVKLEKLSDLKKAHIYSRKALEEYLKQYKDNSI